MTTAAVSTRRAQTRDRLMDAAIALFAEKGILAASVEEICERAGFTRGAFYSNFDSKDELLVAVLERKGEEILQATTNATSTVPGERIEPRSVDDVIRQALVVFQASHPIDPEWLLARSEMRLYALRNPPVRQPVQDVENSLDSLLIAAIEDVVARQGARLIVPAEHLVIVLNAYYEALATRAMMAGGDLSENKLAGTHWSDYLAGLVRALVDFGADS
ncbi:MAG: TetR/AcrR family transcriptional regulator [Propionicimonas sp.]|nr:TetR/AcrR family transcriptional regulator [Propionicimonas sp.]